MTDTRRGMVPLHFDDLLKERRFDNKKLEYVRYFENLLRLEIEDIIKLTKTIFILVTNENLVSRTIQQEIQTFLRIILEKLTVFIPIRDDIKSIINHVFEERYVIDVTTEFKAKHVEIRIKIDPNRRDEFYKEYNLFFQDVSLFLNMICKGDTRLVFI